MKNRDFGPFCNHFHQIFGLSSIKIVKKTPQKTIAMIFFQTLRRIYRCGVCTNQEASGPRLNINTVFPRYGDSHVKGKMVGETVLSLTWESLNW